MPKFQLNLKKCRKEIRARSFYDLMQLELSCVIRWGFRRKPGCHSLSSFPLSLSQIQNIRKLEMVFDSGEQNYAHAFVTQSCL